VGPMAGPSLRPGTSRNKPTTRNCAAASNQHCGWQGTRHTNSLLQGRRHVPEVVLLVAHDAEQVPDVDKVVLPEDRQLVTHGTVC
jgi:hypothetical protein